MDTRLPRPPLRLPIAAQTARYVGDRNRLPRAGHRREHRDLHGCADGAARIAAVSRPDATHAALRVVDLQRTAWPGLRLGAELPRRQAREHGVRDDRGNERRWRGSRRRRRAAGAHPVGQEHSRSVLRARGQADIRPHVRIGRGRGRPQRRDSERRVLPPAVRRRREVDRNTDLAQQHAIYSHRRDARRLRLSDLAKPQRRVGPARVHAREPQVARVALASGGCPTETGARFPLLERAPQAALRSTLPRLPE